MPVVTHTIHVGVALNRALGNDAFDHRIPSGSQLLGGIRRQSTIHH
jgi:hypothetical protein